MNGAPGSGDAAGGGDAAVGPEPGRYDVALRGRILVAGEVEQLCVLATVRGRVAELTTEHPGVEGRRTRAVAYIDDVGRLEGAAVRVAFRRVALTVEAPDAKWARLRQDFALLTRRPDLRRGDAREHLRVTPDVRSVEVVLAHDVVVAGTLRDVSRSGVAVEAEAAVEVGDPVVVGRTRGRVVRRFAGGFAVQFARLLPLECLDGGVRL